MKHKLLVEEMGRLTAAEYKAAEKLPVVAVLDNVRSLYNVGSVFRTADAFRLEGVVLCGVSGCPPKTEIHKTALGAEDSVDWRYFSETIDAVNTLRAEGFEIVAVEQVQSSVFLQEFRPEKGKKYALLFGNEVKGVCQEAVDAADVCLEIPQFGTKHSLNVSVSAGIVLWHFADGLRV